MYVCICIYIWARRFFWLIFGICNFLSSNFLSLYYLRHRLKPNFPKWFFIFFSCYRILHTYNLIWVVCHFFSQQRWRTRTNIQSWETIGQENHVTCVKLRPRKFRPAFFLEPIPRHVFSINTSFSNTLSIFPNFHCSADTLSSNSPTELKSRKKKKKMDKPRRLSFLVYTLTMRLFPVSEKPTVSNHKKK